MSDTTAAQVATDKFKEILRFCNEAQHPAFHHIANALAIGRMMGYLEGVAAATNLNPQAQKEGGE